MDKRLERILPRVQKPARYTGGEFNQIIKDKSAVELRVGVCFPDAYEIGMSNLGVQIIYGVMNNMPGVWCERVYAPWADMEREMREQDIPLWALESGDPVSELDALGFSLGYEMAYVDVLNMLDLGKIHLRSADREELLPLIFAGGTSCCNPEPMADFLDLMAIGEGEELSVELLELLKTAKKEGWSKRDFLERAAKIEGIYVPSLYSPEYLPDGRLSALTPLSGAPERVTKRIVEDFDSAFYPTSPLVPTTEIVHDRVSLELFRGCIRGCRFCQAGYVYRPVRSRRAETLIEQGIDSLKNTGYQEITLSSLSTSDYRELPALCDGLLDYCEPRSISLSLPSLRADNFSFEIMQRVQRVRKGGLTFAPEAGSQRLRDAINKNVTEEELLESLRVAFEGGWNGVKLYFMLGLPTETDEDVVAIAELAERVLQTWKRHASNKSRGVRITVSTSCFIPKPHSPFQWEAQVEREEYLRRVRLLRDSLKSKAITYNWHDADTSLVEAVLSRGDRRIGGVIERVWQAGARLQAWSENFELERWLRAFEDCGIDPDFYALRQRERDELLPWSRVETGATADFLWSEREQAYRAELTPDCRAQCMGCGASGLLRGGACDA